MKEACFVICTPLKDFSYLVEVVLPQSLTGDDNSIVLFPLSCNYYVIDLVIVASSLLKLSEQSTCN